LFLEYTKFNIKVIPKGKGPFVGWEVDCNERFLLGNFIVTHNSRISNGKDAASPRYIYTELSDITRNIFNPSDDPILNYIEDDGVSIEPEYFIPTLPMVLINGTLGIGTAYSTFVPNYNPKDIIDNITRHLSDKPMLDIFPWYRDFKGNIIDNVMYGKFNRVNDTKLCITELPLISIDDYLEFLENLIQQSLFGIKNVVNKSNEKDINIEILFGSKSSLDAVLSDETVSIYKTLKLYKNISTSNMHLFDAENKIKKYNDPNDIIKDFIKVKLAFNLKRKNYLIKSYTDEMILLSNKIRFLYEIINDTLVIYKKPKKEIISLIKTKNYNIIDNDNNYSYLLGMNISSFTEETIGSLEG